MSTTESKGALALAASSQPPVSPLMPVLAWQQAPGRPLEYGAECAGSLVQLIEVGDGQAGDLPADSDLWPWIAIACFEYAGRPVPLLDTARLFAGLQR